MFQHILDKIYFKIFSFVLDVLSVINGSSTCNKRGCPFTLIAGRKGQLLNFMNLRMSNYGKLNNINLYKYKVNKFKKGKHTANDVFQIQETFDGSFTEGGTMFEVLNTGKQFVSTCPIIDLFNGSYLFCCDYHGFCGNITVKVIYHNFGGYWKRVPLPLERMIWEKDTCINKTTKKIKYRQCRARELQGLQFNGYFLKNNQPHCNENCYSWASGKCFVPRIKGRWNECIAQQKSITFIGDSQMR